MSSQPSDNPQRVYWPQPVEVEESIEGVPVSVAAVAVEAVREQWVVEDQWWTPRPISRRYFELALADGRCVVVFSETGRWFSQRA
jgi:hypothetical protein